MPHGGWGWGAPPPPKPGVIPLAPLGLGGILGGAFGTLGRSWKQLLGMSLLVFGFLGLLAGAAVYLGYDSLEKSLLELETRETLPDAETMTSFAFGFGVVWVGALLLVLLGTSLVQAACAAALRGAVLGRTVPFGTVWRESWSRVWAVVGANLLVAVMTVVPVFFLFAVGWVSAMVSLFSMLEEAPQLWSIPGWLAPVALLAALGAGLVGVWLWVRFSLAPAAVVFEGLGPIAALRRSARLVHGDWWRVFGITLLAAIMAGFAAWIVQMPFQLAGMIPTASLSAGSPQEPSLAPVLAAMVSSIAITTLGSVIAQTVTSVFAPLMNAVLYVDRRMRTENLAASLAEAAGVRPAPQPYPQTPPQPYAGPSHPA
ncbi:hypothetical protein J116_022120 [Streptomyces thermolilacinus SPC6]|uniref:DUF7847 domain-containing protein n=1 Tax=Streptomyces thermolilacinus SPC6 TaxID=1306406 RepID=A0A1D3E148_9ACTN|nr:hypothetical protein J116_022120 [Streptomyces thermolilacinus SPC6]